MGPSKSTRFPVGHEVTLAELESDPYPVYARLRAREPVSWLPALNMWYVTGYEDVRTALLDTAHLTTVSDHSTIFDTFGAHMLTTENPIHDRYRRAAQYAFTPAFIRENLDEAISNLTAGLVRQFRNRGCAELRSAFASRLPIQVILFVCGLPMDAEPGMRRWYDSFEAALANFAGDSAIRAAAKLSVGEFHALLEEAIRTCAAEAGEDTGLRSLISRMVNAPPAERLSDDEIKRNLSIIFFGGISTVEALLLNCLWALFEHPGVFARVTADRSLLPQVIDETMRWLSPVQSATRHVLEPFEWRGLRFEKDEIVNCMLGAANRDPSVFSDPDRFDVDRANVRRHLGFATGLHSCLGSQLARTEARIALEALLQLPELQLDRAASEPPTGYEFRQSRRLVVQWREGETKD
ncbi:MAG: cytochrome P450 [Proteobacteria bacterium]|nr:cytochrome P450 [Pseudomonadota bacterium]